MLKGTIPASSTMTTRRFVQLVKQSLPFDVLRGDVRKSDAVHAALLEHFASFVRHHVDEPLRLEVLDE